MCQKVNKLKALYGDVYIREFNNYYIVIDKYYEDWMLEQFWHQLEELLEIRGLGSMQAYQTIRGRVDFKVIKK
jgi:hypothetical protein